MREKERTNKRVLYRNNSADEHSTLAKTKKKQQKILNKQEQKLK